MHVEGNGMNGWALAGTALAGMLAAGAWLRSRAPAGNFYETEVYGLTRRTHRRYALVCLAFCGAFAAGLAGVAVIPVVPLLAVFAVMAILYGTSFLRGFSDEE